MNLIINDLGLNQLNNEKDLLGIIEYFNLNILILLLKILKWDNLLLYLVYSIFIYFYDNNQYILTHFF